MTDFGECYVIYAENSSSEVALQRDAARVFRVAGVDRPAMLVFDDRLSCERFIGAGRRTELFPALTTLGAVRYFAAQHDIAVARVGQDGTATSSGLTEAGGARPAVPDLDVWGVAHILSYLALAGAGLDGGSTEEAGRLLYGLFAAQEGTPVAMQSMLDDVGAVLATTRADWGDDGVQSLADTFSDVVAGKLSPEQRQWVLAHVRRVMSVNGLTASQRRYCARLGTAWRLE